MEGFNAFDHWDRFGEITPRLSALLDAGRLVHREHVLDGLERAPEALNMLFTGDNTGKLVVQVSPAASDAYQGQSDDDTVATGRLSTSTVSAVRSDSHRAHGNRPRAAMASATRSTARTKAASRRGVLSASARVHTLLNALSMRSCNRAATKSLSQA